MSHSLVDVLNWQDAYGLSEDSVFTFSSAAVQAKSMVWFLHVSSQQLASFGFSWLESVIQLYMFPPVCVLAERAVSQTTLCFVALADLQGDSHNEPIRDSASCGLLSLH